MVDSIVWAGTLVWLLSQCREVMASGEAGVSAQSWKAVCRSWSADNFCRQALSRRGDWLSRFCPWIFGGIDSRVAGASGPLNHLRSQSTPRSICSFCPRLLSKMELLSAGDSYRPICFCSLRKGAQAKIFAGIDGPERYISRDTTSPRSPFSFGWPWNPRSGDHECAWASSIKNGGKNLDWGNKRWQTAMWWGISSCLSGEECTGGHSQGKGEGGVGGSKICWEHQFSQTWPPSRERHVIVAHCHSDRQPWFVFTQRCIQRRTGATVWLETATPTWSLRMWWCLFRWPRYGVQDRRLPHP